MKRVTGSCPTLMVIQKYAAFRSPRNKTLTLVVWGGGEHLFQLRGESPTHQLSFQKCRGAAAVAAEGTSLEYAGHLSRSLDPMCLKMETVNIILSHLRIGIGISGALPILI